MSSRNFVNEHADLKRRALHSETVLRAGPTVSSPRTGAPVTSPTTVVSPTLAAATGVASPSADELPHMEVEVPEHASHFFRSSSPTEWFKAGAEYAKKNQKVVLKVGIVFVVMIVLLVVLVTIATQSGNEPDKTFPRLLLFMVDGVPVKSFKEAAALRRVPSMDYFASQSANCRPMNQDEYFQPLRSGETTLTSRFKECTMRDTASRTGTVFSLLTGTSFKDTTIGSASGVTLDSISQGARNFTTFLSKARDLGLSSAIIGASPFLTVKGTSSSASKNNNNNNDANSIQPLCGILDSECVAKAVREDRIPPCTVPATANQAFGQMITSSSSCNSAFQGLVSPSDTPKQIYQRARYALEEEAEVIVVQIPEDTVRYWISLRTTAATESASNGNNEAADVMDAVLYEIDGIFSKLLRSVTLQAVDQGQQWLTLLVVSSAAEQDILIASNVIANGKREDVPGAAGSVVSMAPEQLFNVIVEWLKR